MYYHTHRRNADTRLFSSFFSTFIIFEIDLLNMLYILYYTIRHINNAKK